MVGARTWPETGGVPEGLAREPVTSSSAQTRSCRVLSGGGLEAYARLCSRGLSSPAQGAAWLEAWAANVASDYIVATILADGEPVFGLALEVIRIGPFKAARFMGGKHANGNFPAAAPGFASSATAADFSALFGAIRESRPDIDILALERLVADLDGTSNPLMVLPHSTSPNLALEVDLTPGFDVICGRSKNLRSKHRWQIRKFEDAGGHRRIEAGTADEVATLLEEFFRQKEIRLRKMGVANSFGEPNVRRFFHALFASAIGQQRPAFVLHGLQIGGKLRAVTGSSRSSERVTCEIVSIAEDDVTRLRPGEFLFYENIREAVEQGLRVYDFGVGDEPHKRRWCDVEVRHYDVIVPFGLKGHLLAGSLRIATRLKTFIRENPTLWKITKTLRQRAAGEKPEADGRDD